MTAEVALVFPPGWYYTSHPADLSYPAGFLRSAGHRVRTVDLNQRYLQVVFGALPEAAALRSPQTYADPARHRAALAGLSARSAEVSRRYGVDHTPRATTFPGVDLRDWVAGRAAGLSPRNPAAPLLHRAAADLAASGVPVIAVALVHPDQVPHAAALVRWLREHGFRGVLALYGVMEDVLSPLDFAPDLEGEPRHAIFEDVDAVVVGETEQALAAITRRDPWSSVPDVVAPGHGVHRPRPSPPLALADHPGPSFADLAPAALTPVPVVDLRLGRGCPWGRCTFCAIQAHQVGYRAAPATAVAAAMDRAHSASGAVFFRIRDDLLTSRQLVALADAVDTLPFRPRWSARARLEPSVATVLERARRSGLEELWVGMESASERVRGSMDKGVSDLDLDRFLAAAATAALRVRLLCLVGFPGETEAEAQSTLAFVSANAHRLASCSLTPFLLARRAPLALAPPAAVHLLPDPVPRHHRVAATLPHRIDGGVHLPPLLAQAARDLIPRFPDFLGPDLHHDWMAASVRSGGWPPGQLC